VRATGEVRRSGVPKGQKAKAKLPGGSRAIKSLDRIYAEEGLPPRQELPAGERKMLDRHNCSGFLTSLAQDRVAPRKSQKSEHKG
jgi:hypothetical protein